jgi:hypothetical protein
MNLPVRVVASGLTLAYVKNQKIAFRQEGKTFPVLSKREPTSRILDYRQLQKTDFIDLESFNQSRFATHFDCDLGY